MFKDYVKHENVKALEMLRTSLLAELETHKKALTTADEVLYIFRAQGRVYAIEELISTIDNKLKE